MFYFVISFVLNISACVFAFIHARPRRLDDLNDLHLLLKHVTDSEVLVLLQTKGVLTRPWVIIELYTALTNQVPVVALNVMNANPYEYSDAAELLRHLDMDLDGMNPGATDMLRKHGVDPVDAAFRLADALPALISTNFDPNGSTRQIEAALGDLADQIRQATPIVPPSISKEEWLEKRKVTETKRKHRPHGWRCDQGTDSAAAQMLADVPDTVPELPGALLVRSEIIAQINSEILNEAGSSTAALTSHKAKHKSSVHGMGGVGEKCASPRPCLPLPTPAHSVPTP